MGILWHFMPLNSTHGMWFLKSFPFLYAATSFTDTEADLKKKKTQTTNQQNKTVHI